MGSLQVVLEVGAQHVLIDHGLTANTVRANVVAYLVEIKSVPVQVGDELVESSCVIDHPYVLSELMLLELFPVWWGDVLANLVILLLRHSVAIYFLRGHLVASLVLVGAHGMLVLFVHARVLGDAVFLVLLREERGQVVEVERSLLAIALGPDPLLTRLLLDDRLERLLKYVALHVVVGVLVHGHLQLEVLRQDLAINTALLDEHIFLHVLQRLQAKVHVDDGYGLRAVPLRVEHDVLFLLQLVDGGAALLSSTVLDALALNLEADRHELAVEVAHARTELTNHAGHLGLMTLPGGG